MIKFQQSQALTSHFERFWSIVAILLGNKMFIHKVWMIKERVGWNGAIDVLQHFVFVFFWCNKFAKITFFHNRAAELELLYYSVILTFSRKNGTPAGAARFHPFFPPLRPAEESILWKQFLCCIEEVEIWKFTKWGVTFLRRIGSTWKFLRISSSP